MTACWAVNNFLVENHKSQSEWLLTAKARNVHTPRPRLTNGVNCSAILREVAVLQIVISGRSTLRSFNLEDRRQADASPLAGIVPDHHRLKFIDVRPTHRAQTDMIPALDFERLPAGKEDRKGTNGSALTKS
jgi:hypothetical protein